MEDRQVLLLIHTGREEASRVAAAFTEGVRSAGIGVRVVKEEEEQLRRWVDGEIDVVDAGPHAADGCELAVVFGGDGTILRGAEMVRAARKPLLGINLGHVGFLAEADVEDLDNTVRRVVDRDYEVEERMSLEVSVQVAGEIVATSWALNEAAVEKSSPGRMLEVVVEVDDRPLSRWGCDGVVCATPTGSTAYNFSTGGAIVWPEVEALLMMPISAHALFARPMVVSPRSKLAIELLADAPSGGVLSCDGRRTFELPPGARVEVRKGMTAVRLARLHQAPFTDRLVRKFDLPVSGWRGTPARGQHRSDENGTD